MNNEPNVNEQKALWQIQMDLAKVLLALCENYNIKIFAGFGTLLGAARHQGFIPWDDDMDFIMMRSEYDKLLSVIKSHPSLPDNMSFDISSVKVIKLRDKNTTMRLKSQKLTKEMNHGVWIDIFALDIAPDNVAESLEMLNKRNQGIRQFVNGTLFHYAFQPSLHYKLGHFYCRLFFLLHNKETERKRIEDEFRNDKERYSCRYVWPFLILSTMVSLSKIKKYEAEWFKETISLPFEDISLPCPKEYDKVLTAQYGDWRVPVKGTSGHEGTIVNPFLPFNQYVEQELRSIPWWKRYWYKH